MLLPWFYNLVAGLARRTEGVLGLYRGFNASVMMFVPSSAIWWGSYGGCAPSWLPRMLARSPWRDVTELNTTRQRRSSDGERGFQTEYYVSTGSASISSAVCAEYLAPCAHMRRRIVSSAGV